ncbi:DUF58 domain-containing protein [Arthrobacter echini]|uniref:DUF58 domain-containing protein n=1 Tax=Arthrobacter echini TaxID=1529066 RepID=A0A5D0XTG7_9MICC|nr:DUF58 domain-containing protein [Arthrobacter echini]TYC99661.1 DUF58 domain-containing protein [Arthrobacter echini]
MANGAETARSPGWAVALIIALVCIVAGLVSGRPETVALAAPFALLVLSGRSTVDGAQEPSVRIAADRRMEGSGRLRLLLTSLPPGGAHTAETTRAEQSAAGNARPASSLVAVTLAAPACPADALVLRADEDCPLLVDVPGSGEIAVLSYGSAGFSADLMITTAFVPAPAVRVTILPQLGGTVALPVSRRLSGVTGSHTSRRPGEGGELRSIAPMQPGDQLRRIDWRATARRSADQDRLMVRRNFADAEASVLLIIDQGHDLPASTEDWFSSTTDLTGQGSLHVARTAAATVAASYLAAGDRVGLDDLSGTRRALRTASGGRHLEQIRTRLAGTAVVPRRRRRRDPVPPQGAVVLVFSAFLDPEPARLLRLWHAQGHVVVGVDCVPQLERTEASPAQALTVRLTLVRRRLLLENLRAEGIPVLSGAAARSAAPHTTSRDARGPGLPGTTTDTEEFGAALDLGSGLRLLARRTGRGAGQTPAPGTTRSLP